MVWYRALLEHPYPAIQWGTVLGASLVATYTDYRTRRIPNALTLPVLAAGVVQAAIVGGWTGLADSFAGTVGLALPYLILYATAGGGAGDAKLMGAVGAWLGVLKGAVALVAICLSGVLVALLVALARRDLRRTLRSLADLLGSAAADVSARRAPQLELAPTSAPEEKKMAYAPAIGLGLLCACTSWHLWHA